MLDDYEVLHYLVPLHNTTQIKLAEIRRRGPTVQSSDEDLSPYIRQGIDEIGRAESILGRLIPPANSRMKGAWRDFPDWETFRIRDLDMDAPAFPYVWEYVFDAIVDARKDAAPTNYEDAILSTVAIPRVPLVRPAWIGEAKARRLDDLRRDRDIAKREREEFDDEYAKAFGQRLEIVRPDRLLYLGLVALLPLAIAGVIAPLYTLSTGPEPSRTKSAVYSPGS